MLIKILFLIGLFFSFAPGAQSYAQDGGEAPNRNPSQTAGGVINGRAVNLVKPVYPQTARAAKAQGAVNVQVTLDEEGNVISASAVAGHPLLRAAAVEAARQSKFRPTVKDGKPVKATGVIVYNFVLPDELNPTTNQATNQMKESERLMVMGMVMFLTSLKDIPGDDESDRLVLLLGDALPASMKTGKALFEKLVDAESQSAKAAAIDEIVASMRRNLTGTDAWMIDLGKQWGGAIGEAFKITGSDFRLDRKNFINSLQGMSWLLESPPAEVSAESLRRIRAIAAYDNDTDSITPDFIKNFFRSSFEFIDYIVNENKGKK